MLALLHRVTAGLLVGLFIVVAAGCGSGGGGGGGLAGGIGGTGFTPIVHTPEVAILGVSRAVIKPVCIDKEFVPRLVLPFSLSYLFVGDKILNQLNQYS